VEVTTGPLVVVEPCPCSVVLVGETTTVVPATFVVSVTGIVVLVVVVVSWPGTVVAGTVDGGVVVVDVDVVVASLVVVVTCGSVIGVVVVDVHSHVVLEGGVVVLVVQRQLVLVVGGDVVLVVQRQLVLVLELGGVNDPQNCTLEMSGVLPSPTLGRPAFEK